MNIVFSTSGDSLDAPLDARFGRAPKFLLYDLEAGLARLIDNKEGRAASQGAGIQAAESVARAGAGAVVTGHCGPKAFAVLRTAGIKVYSCRAATVGEALAQYRSGALVEQTEADVAGHHA
ncbi:MAG: NifB/NifX family molybdenum-iron cluster-binding protein [Holophagales bacterium]|jgi:predicted Fe-Mo cluster-binding NifX family protein|nr:NifB/NifX family molybdenum-iron cluster-binding protein [Holophagales bacterium]MBK9964923.1 NifB/NifX family molybdenum-iron cluster-binding protein [Holophagales bacterium]